ncbi:hypothetical protein VUR80DRAFT_8329 [Thermomyces stellatus]
MKGAKQKSLAWHPRPLPRLLPPLPQHERRGAHIALLRGPPVRPRPACNNCGGLLTTSGTHIAGGLWASIGGDCRRVFRTRAAFRGPTRLPDGAAFGPFLLSFLLDRLLLALTRRLCESTAERRKTPLTNLCVTDRLGRCAWQDYLIRCNTCKYM